ncbi:alkylhydroperoxidase [Alkalihalobacillus alcalophilus ATCC 27647 = CGMCC 1.3604]|uniref:Alkylhydroperoxidase n=1 Tax=Alkalihalobacillus alcalophilus ATCC 27647 = CGMCC 1.3604 TaxID=1218173 RepID=A0A094WQU2_ALKAL|nr:carboxymuconolactone decarboxylase family protein [Alkalihalobacillus alcalophilus]KGA98408.1 alkylhydroperoxidase [Alkalihalobacillus alcalophilus ATCC 27647 = CGMCC 1.3604]MED1563945.1 carboxymuconolactone decarboxylase family protein [Alkalihalobacillus alcalophilus]THG91570.1 alkylhydroperoxidase [Alkalihalobacillus alcalophilus ATCC 27647 = CGMCC 1.3604]
MDRIKKSAYGQTSFQQLLGHNRNILTKWTDLGDELEKDGSLSAQLKEQVRRSLAQQNHCEYCKAKGGPNTAIFDEKTSLAVGFAEVVVKQNGKMSEPMFAVLKEGFSDKEISELCAFICFTIGQQYFGAVMGIR